MQPVFETYSGETGAVFYHRPPLVALLYPFQVTHGYHEIMLFRVLNYFGGQLLNAVTHLVVLLPVPFSTIGTVFRLPSQPEVVGLGVPYVVPVEHCLPAG